MLNLEKRPISGLLLGQARNSLMLGWVAVQTLNSRRSCVEEYVVTGQTNIFYDIGGAGKRELLLFHGVLVSNRVSAEPVD